MSALITQIAPWLAAVFAAAVALVGVYFSGKKTGKSEKQAELTTKTNEQAAQSAKVVRDVQEENRRLPPGDVADALRSRWGVRKPPAGGE